ncbi:Alpha/Beta hydrolase protein, partial [Delphinella strobiligena]
GARPRWVLHLQAQMWRYLMGIGMFLHRSAHPRPPKPSFTRSIKSTVSVKEGNFNLCFYVPDDYEQRLQELDPKAGPKASHKGYPCIINFHGGGFTLGDPTDDARWCGTVVEQCDAVVVSVDYRRAPECPFPTAVEDGVDAVLYIAKNAASLGINPNKIALSGFSSGANMAFSVPLRLYDHMTEFNRTITHESANIPVPSIQEEPDVARILTRTSTNSTIGNSLLQPPTRPGLTNLPGASATSVNRILRSRSEMHQAGATTEEIYQDIQVCAIVPWYPSCDYTQTREERRTTSLRKDQDLPSLFTDLFDQSYLHPPDTIPLDSPYLSPGIAPSLLLREALPNEIIMHTCEWDMLLAEGEAFKTRLLGDEIGKNVVYVMVEGVPHGWDKAPNPIKPTPGVKEHYLRACKELRRVFRQVDQ